MIMIHYHNFPVTVVNVSMDQRTEMKLWCKDNIGESVRDWSYTYDLSGSATFYFSTNEFATLFKLTWM